VNLYDKDDGFRQFSLAEANEILPDVVSATETTLQKLEKVKKEFDAEKKSGPKRAEKVLTERSQKILENWSRTIVSLGAYPKGYFTVDFKSHVPDTLLCWTLGEDQIGHTHKIYETFRERIAITSASHIGFENTTN